MSAHPTRARYPTLCASLAALGVELPSSGLEQGIRFEAGGETHGAPSAMSIAILPSAGALLVLETRIAGVKPGVPPADALRCLMQGLGALAHEPGAGIVTYAPSSHALLLQHWFDPLIDTDALRAMIETSIARTRALRTYLSVRAAACVAVHPAAQDIRGVRAALRFTEATFRAR